MITCEFNGRLGNNLFQIANLASLSTKLGVDFILPEHTLAGHRGTLPVSLDMFSYSFSRGIYNPPTEYCEKSYEYSQIEASDNIKLIGFYQSWKYFQDIRTELLNKYFMPSGKVLESLARYDVSNHSLGISVRRGDYLMLQNNHCVLGVGYYQDILDKYFQDNVDQIFIFSDDLPWCRQVFGPAVSYVEDTIGTQLFLMSKMKHLILSNSTFAWWGAYLNQNQGTIVAPDPWFGPNHGDKNTEDLYYSSWIKGTHTMQQQPYELTQNMFD